jgi:DNA-binding response OmpR family regulator
MAERPATAQHAGWPGPPILVVGSDRCLGRSLTGQLVADGYLAALADTAQRARALARATPPRLVVIGELDPPCGALELLREIRSCSSADPPWEPGLPVIVVSPRADELDVLRAFDAGADDFLARPAGYLELRARLRAILRRSEVGGVRRLLEVGTLTIDLDTRAVSVDGQPVELRPLEFELLVHLAREPQRVCSKDELLRIVWGFRANASTRTVDSHASRLRRRLDVDGARRWVVNVWGVGYRLS